MITYRYSLAALATVLAATAIASINLHRSDAKVPKADVQTEQSHQSRGDTNAHAYLPDLFVEEERAAPIEPMPPQF